jgi:glycosyltransferase involved in cell wall biosynthesis
MCEAMASGLVPVTSSNTAIPEFVTHNVTGLLTNSPQQIADELENLLQFPEKFCKISQQAADSIREKCNIKAITKRELSIIES